MKIAIARPGYFNDNRYKPSMQTNWMNYDLLSSELKKLGVKITTIGFNKRSGAFRSLNIRGLGDIQFSKKRYRTKTQQAVTSSIALESNGSLLDGVDALLMPYYTFFEERCYYYTLAYQAASYSIPLIIWDTDANFIGQVAGTGSHFSIEQARNKVFKDPVYVNDNIVYTDIIDDLKMAVLSPALVGPKFVTYFPFFHIFGRNLSFEPKHKIYDTVYAGSEYQRESLLMKYYSTGLYSSRLCGKFSKKFIDRWRDWESVYHGHISRKFVQNFLWNGKVCIHIARNAYNRIGHITPRVYEVVDSGTLLLIDSGLQGGDQVVGKEFIVSSAYEVADWIHLGNNTLRQYWEEQREAPFIIDASVEKRAEQLVRLIKVL